MLVTLCIACSCRPMQLSWSASKGAYIKPITLVLAPLLVTVLCTIYPVTTAHHSQSVYLQTTLQWGALHGVSCMHVMNGAFVIWM